MSAPRVRRERLLATLRESLDCCVATILSGRTGTGKTALVTDFAEDCGRPVAWYKVDAPDSELAVFFQYLCASVRRQRPGFGEQLVARLGEVVGIEDVPLLVEYFIYELLESDAPLLVVIDDLHLVYDADWVVPFFRRLLPLLPPEVHMILLGRSLPPAPLWRMRSKQTLYVIDEQELAFTLEEAQEMFASFNLPVEQARGAWERTRGRATTLEDLARLIAEAAEATREAHSREERPQPHPGRLRLVKNYTPESSLGTA